MQESFLDTSVDMQAALTNIEADAVLLKAAVHLKYKNPTLIQSKLFELSQEKKHIVLKSKASSGKTSGTLMVGVHKMIQAINKQKKKPHFMVIICPNKAVCNANEALLEKVISYAKEEYEISHLNLTKTAYEVFENEMFLEAKKRLIVIGTPALYKKMLLSLPNTEAFHQGVETIFLDELNFMFSFGYENDIKELLALYKERSEKINIIFSLSNEDERVKSLKTLIMKDSATLKFNDQGDGSNGMDQIALVNEFFHISDDVGKYISLYVLFKLKFIGGRTLILCRDIDEAYKVNAFLERCQIKTSKVYSNEWPLKVRQYYATIFNSSVINILVATTEIFELGRQTPNNKAGLREIDNIITWELDLIVDLYDKLPDFLDSRKSIPCLIEFLNPTEDNKELLFSLLETAKNRAKGNGIQQLPIKEDQLRSFRYRCTDILEGITNKQINGLKTLDIKRQILKSKELKEYFEEHQKERDLVIHDLEAVSKKIALHSVKMESDVPSYLISDAAIRNEIIPKENKTRGRIIKERYNEEYESNLAKRMAANNMSLDDVKKKRKMTGDKYMKVRDDLEDPLVTDSTRLIPLSNRKLWKMKHKKPLKKINKRLQRKGIFES